MTHHAPAPATEPAIENRIRTRRRLEERIHSIARQAIDDPGLEQSARVDILHHLLDPRADVIERAITNWARGDKVPTITRERISDYITRAFERAVLGTARSPMQLADLVKASSPYAWGDRFAGACVQSGITEVRRAQRRELGADLQMLAEVIPMQPVASLDWEAGVLSAEDAFLARERRGMVNTLTEIIATWGERGVTGFARVQESARAARMLLGLPAAAVEDEHHKRWLERFLATDGAEDAVRMSLVAHRDLASGDPQWDQLAVEDRLLDLWMDYTAEQATALLSAPADAVMAIVRDTALFAPRPREPRRTAVRRLAKNLSKSRGWSSLVMRLERAWAAEFFSARTDINGYDMRDDDEAEAERAADAADWPAAAQEALTFPERPFGPAVRTPHDVAEWLFRAYSLPRPLREEEAA